MVVEILVAQRDPVDALAQQIDLRVGDEVRRAWIGDHRIQRAHPTQPPIDRAPHHHPAIAGDITPGKTRLDFAAIKALKMKQFGVTVWHERSPFGCWLEQFQP